MDLLTPIENIPKIGPAYQKKLKRLGIKNVSQLIFHFPHRYEDFSNIVPIASAPLDALICVQGKIEKIKLVRIFRRRMTIVEAVVEDASGKINVTWFNQPYLVDTLKEGDFVFLAGKITNKKGKKYLSAPSYEKVPQQFIESEMRYDSTHTGRLIPVYPETEGLSSRWLRYIIKPILTQLKNNVAEPLPQEILKENNLLSINDAIRQIHFPDSKKSAETAKKRFIFEELFNLALLILKEKINLSKEKSAAIPANMELIKKFTGMLPFKLTDDQRKAAYQILKDLEKNKPMNRLLDGDVGSGKTIVAVIAMLNAVKANFQVALMAPTEILTKQHYKTITKLLAPFKLEIGLITGKENYINNSKVKRKELLEKIKKGEINILIGTHALISSSAPTSVGATDGRSKNSVEFKNLGLVIIDEQHRFGIEQRASLCKNKGIVPHLLSMSATPIPRTLALTIYGDLDLSLIKEMPKGRKQIITQIIPPQKRDEAYAFIRQQVEEGRQVFVICPRIEPPARDNTYNEVNSEISLLDSRKLLWSEIKAVKEEYEKLSQKTFKDLNVSMLHGKMKSAEKDEILNNFKNKKIDILVSTSVVEVGIDFPNATIMMIEGADRFGLSQLHQFRGRVGRGEHQSYCLLFSDFIHNPRLRAMVKTQDGFELAEKDLKLRGPGDLTGIRQWGVPSFVMSTLITDLPLVKKTKEAAKKIIEKDPTLKKHLILKNKLEQLQTNIHLE